MIPAPESTPAGEASPVSGGPPGYPFQGPGLLARVWPFAAIAVLAEASLILPRGPASMSAVIVSAVLLLAAAAAFLLPWSRLPGWMPVLVPLLYTGSVLALILAAGSASGVGIVILVPLIWTTLFQRLWESACVVVAIVAVEVIISLVPVASPDAVIARRVILWSVLGAVIGVATHGMRDRIRHAQEQAARLQDRLREVSIIEDRDRIAGDLRDKVIQGIFSAGLTLHSAAARTADKYVQDRIAETVSDLDEVIVMLRDTISGLGHQLKGHGLHAEVARLCEELQLEPELSFSGPVDGALHPGTRAALIELLRDALALIAQHRFTASLIGISTADSSCITVVRAVPVRGAQADGEAPGFPSLRHSAARAGIDIDIEPGPDSTRFAWHIPLGSP